MESIKEFRGNELAQASAVKEDLTCSSSSPLNKSDQAISDSTATANDSVRPGPGYKLQAASVQCGPNRQAPSMAFRDDRSGDRGSRSSHKVLLVQKRLPGL